MTPQVAERPTLGYWLPAVMFLAIIGAVAVAHYRLKLNAVLAFWLAYILTRPLGDFLSQPSSVHGLALGTTVTSMIFLAAILIVVALRAPPPQHLPCSKPSASGHRPDRPGSTC